MMCGQVWCPILGVCALHLTHPSAHTQQWDMKKHTHTLTHCEHPPWAVGCQCCGTRGAVGVSVPCSRVSPQSWYWEWRECWAFTPPPTPTIPAGPETRTCSLQVTSPLFHGFPKLDPGNVPALLSIMSVLLMQSVMTVLMMVMIHKQYTDLILQSHLKDNWWGQLTEIFVLCTHGVYHSVELASSTPSHSWIIVYQGCWLLSSAVNQTCLSIQGELECRWGLVNWPNAMHWVGRNARLPLSAVGRSSVPCLSVWCSEEVACGDGSWVEQLNPESSACSCRMEVKCGIVHQAKWFFQEVLEW